jgi:hypothetical protein
VTLQKENNCSCFEGKLGGNYEINCTITEYEARGQAFSKGGGNITVLAFHVTWSRALAAASTGSVKRQNSVFIYELNLVNNFFLL